MESLYIIEKGCYLKKDGETLKIMKGKELVETIPCNGLQRLVLAGWASVSGSVLDFLIERKIDTVFMTPTGRFRARLLLDDTGHVLLRQRQYLMLSKPDFVLATAKSIVRGKLENHVRLLRRRAGQYEGGENLRQAALQIRSMVHALEKAQGVEQVRGIEGYGARVMYGVFGLLIRNGDFIFEGRNRRPPLDPVNALLSYTYTLFTSEVENAIRVAGLDPYLGSLHEAGRGKPALACDLVEEWRVFAERLVLTLINRRLVKPDDFIFRSKEEQARLGTGPVEMKPAVSRALVKAYERQMQASLFYPLKGEKTVLRWIIHSQARAFAASLEDGSALYKPFRVPA
jgi:CRISPR-associated protein Cas1